MTGSDLRVAVPCEREHTGPDFDGSSVTFPCGDVATTTVEFVDLFLPREIAAATMEFCTRCVDEILADPDVRVTNMTARDREETDPCEAGTEGCSRRHRGTSDLADRCETW